MTIPGDCSAATPTRRSTRWPALLLPLVAAVAAELDGQAADLNGQAAELDGLADELDENSAELDRHTQALTRRVTRLTETRRHATDAADAELRRIERDLHDGAQARLVAVGMSLRIAEGLMMADPEAAKAYPPVLADRGLADALRALALDAPLAVHTEIAVPVEPPMPVAAAAYFAVAEALANAERHADADAVDIVVTQADGMLRATVIDDGQGGADPALGTGLSGVERRLATFDGILAVSSPPGGPTIIAMEIPYVAYRATGGSLADVLRSSWQTRTII